MNLRATKYDYIVERYINDIYHYSFYMVGNKFDAEDVVQDVLIKVWKNINEFNFFSTKAWIIKITHNQCIDFIRKQNKQNERELSIDNYHEKLTTPDLINEIDNKSLSDIIDKAVLELPEKLKAVFVLYELEGLKYKEIGKVLNIPINSVKVYLMRSRKKLQEELKKYEE